RLKSFYYGNGVLQRFLYEFGQRGAGRMKRAAEFRTEARRIKHAEGRLTEPSLNRATNSGQLDVGRNIDHCRSMLTKGIDAEANRQLLETLLRYMERSVAEAADDPNRHHQHHRL